MIIQKQPSEIHTAFNPIPIWAEKNTTILPDPYIKGSEGSVFLWMSSAAYDYIALRPYDYDANVALQANDGSYKTYKTREIGEYEWTVENLFMEYVNRMGTQLAWVNPTQDIINQMNQEFQQKNNIELAKYNSINGSYITLYPTGSSYRNSFKFYTQRNGSEINGWDLPNSADFMQMMGQAPIISANPIENIMNFLGANKVDVPSDYTADWFEYKNTSGFTMTPLGRRHSGEAGEGGQKWFNYKVESCFRLKDYPYGMILFHRTDGIDIAGNLYHFCQARHTRAKTAQELGYKMYIDAANDQVVMLPYDQTSTLPELPKGMERGVALRYTNRSHMKVLNKWSEIQYEANIINNAIAGIAGQMTIPSISQVIVDDPSSDNVTIHGNAFLPNETIAFILQREYFNDIAKFNISPIVKRWFTDTRINVATNVFYDYSLFVNYELDITNKKYTAINAVVQCGYSPDMTIRRGKFLTIFDRLKKYVGYELDVSAISNTESTPISINMVTMYEGIFNHICINIPDGSVIVSMGLDDDKKGLKIDSPCIPVNPFYVRWVNPIGGRDYWMFSVNQQITTEVSDIQTFNPLIWDIQETTSISKAINMNASSSIKVGSGQLSDIEYKALSSIQFSPKIEWYNKEIGKWLQIIQTEGSINYSTKDTLKSIELEFQLSDIQIQF